MRNVKKYFLWILGAVLALFVAGLLFMRFVVVPSEARSECDQYAREKARDQNGLSAQKTTYDLFYDSCFRQKGLRPER